MKRTRLYRLTMSAMIAALYVVLTVFVGAFDLASGAVQLRLSEALCVLPCFTSAAIPGLFVGCLLANLLVGGTIWDIVFGSLATLLAASVTYLLRRHRFLSLLSPVVFNACILPPVLLYGTMAAETITWEMLAFYAVSIAGGEALSCLLCGTLLARFLDRFQHLLFPSETGGSPRRT